MLFQVGIIGYEDVLLVMIIRFHSVRGYEGLCVGLGGNEV
jgi:hypothetical protein